MDVLIFQMGKVASTAIRRALCRQHVNAVQTHWLGRETVVGSLDNTLLNVDIDKETAFRGLQQFTDNILNTRTLLWYQKHKRCDGEKLRIISLARDPLSWYWGHLAQNFDMYGREITNWYADVSGTPYSNVDLYQAMSVFHQALFDAFGGMQRSVDDPHFEQEAARQGYRGNHAAPLPQQLMKLRLPTVWFDIVFKPPTGIDIYNAPEEISPGVYRYDTEYAEVVLIRYENLDTAIEPLRCSLGLKRLELRKANPTSAKRLPLDFKAFAAEHPPGTAALQKLYTSRYCRFFGYTAAH